MRRGLLRIVLDRRADARDVHVDGAVEGLERLAAHELHQLLARQHAARLLGERHQQLELVAGERALVAVEPHVARVAVDLEPAEAQRRAGPRSAAPRRRRIARRRASSSRGLNGFGR